MCSSKAGQLAGNPFLIIEQDLDRLAEVGRAVLWVRSAHGHVRGGDGAGTAFVALGRGPTLESLSS